MTQTTSDASLPDDEVRARLEAIHAVDPAVRDHGITLGEAAEGRVSLNRDVTADMVNSHGICHGGFLFHLADTALAYCVATLGQTPVTRRADITYIAPARLGARLTAEARQNAAFGRDRVIEVRVSADGELVAYVTGQTTSPRR
ncbi:hotdog domain-containing protein [Micrococcus sp.]|uniref:hotdog domain-containing protein n=1 Tax=Micrococcus sp. TaxID=1271 RepID=UPI002A910F8E|nr:hotdog domain-containing protein [Micrococcus sp.]MDY6055001.1 hotdog domain-containing protein [Micrococcus sp.]